MPTNQSPPLNTKCDGGSLVAVVLCYYSAQFNVRSTMSIEISKNATPSEVFFSFLKAIDNRDGEGSWAMLSQSTQELFAALFGMMDSFVDGFVDATKEAFGAEEPKEGCDPMPDMSDGKTMWVKLITEGKEEEKPGFNLKDVTVKSEEVGDTEAHLTLVDKDGKEQKVDLVKEGGAWKLLLATPGGQ